MDKKEARSEFVANLKINIIDKFVANLKINNYR